MAEDWPAPKGFALGAVLALGKRTCKPNSVQGRSPAAVIPLGAALPRALSSDLPGGSGNFVEQPCGAGPAPGTSLAPDSRLPPYLVLLRVGFTLPAPSPAQRCALTAPFHPYPGVLPGTAGPGAVCFLWHWPSAGLDARVPDVIRHTTLRSSDFPLPADPVSRAPAATARSSCLPLVYPEPSFLLYACGSVVNNRLHQPREARPSKGSIAHGSLRRRRFAPSGDEARRCPERSRRTR
jgi:hypothetical protein